MVFRLKAGKFQPNPLKPCTGLGPSWWRLVPVMTMFSSLRHPANLHPPQMLILKQPCKTSTGLEKNWWGLDTNFPPSKSIIASRRESLGLLRLEWPLTGNLDFWMLELLGTSSLFWNTNNSKFSKKNIFVKNLKIKLNPQNFQKKWNFPEIVSLIFWKVFVKPQFIKLITRLC